MEGLDTLTHALARRTPEQLAALLARHAEPLSRRPAPARLRELAASLWSYETLHQVVLGLGRPCLQVLAATARLSQGRAREAAHGPAAPDPGAGYQSLMAHSLAFPDLAAEPVPEADVYAAFDGDREAVGTALEALYEAGLAAPTEGGRIVVPPRTAQLIGGHDFGAFEPEPSPVSLAAASGPVEERALAAESQAAAAALAGALERLLAALAVQPAALRRSGGPAVREIRRLAKAAGTSEPRTRLLLDLALAADLIALSRTPSGTVALPTSAYDDWLALPPGERLLPVLTAWARHWAIATWTPFGETPTALERGDDRRAPALRHGLLAALATSTDTGTGSGAGSESGAAPGPGVPIPAPDASSLEALRPLVAVAGWHRPLAVADEPMILERAAHTLDEAVFLGLVAYGTLTPVGRALLRAETAADPAPLRAALCTLLPPPLEQALFQGDLTAIVPGPPSAGLSALLALAADRESDDSATAWRFSGASIRRALDAGRTADALIDDLTAASATGPLPHPLTYLIKDTARTHGRIRVVRAGCCIRSDDAALVQELIAHRALRDLGLRAIAPTVLVGAQEPGPTLDALRAAGYAPALEAETGTTVVERTAAHRSQAPLRKPTDHLALARRLLNG
ncbi:helicase-associated domain-containing protein [Streptomyces ochraceiscleroticus]|uniref:Helicase-associated domain-containing protein n=1 Tax=Streptomyces ochraceiscleroticus TaxID=47761 RepID=A0ABW1MNM5_9ACTN|nr:helicase-associated domain-containing protein [Streptomyces ochraceiscleroticus]